jgi:hypothetical protein
MSKAFPTEKDNIIDQMDDDYKLSLTDEEHDSLSKMTKAHLFLVTALLSRAIRKREEDKDCPE